MKLSLRPVFIAWTTLLAHLPLHVFLTLWTGGFVGGIFKTFGERYVSLPFNSYILFGSIMFVGFPLFIFVTKKFNYEKTEYKFFEDRLEFEEGFFTINKKVIKYKDVKELTLRRGILQRVNKLGTIYLGTMVTGSVSYYNPFAALGFGNTAASGISIKDVNDPEVEFEKIQRIIEAGSGLI